MPQASGKASAGDSPRTLYIEQSPVTVTEDGKWIVGKGRSRRTFNSLPELVHGKRSLETLYPNIPKEEAFPIISPTVSSNTSYVADEKNEAIVMNVPETMVTERGEYSVY